MKTMKYIIGIFFIGMVSVFGWSCKKRAQLPSNKYKIVDRTGADMTKLNSLLSDVENDDINKYVKKSKLIFKSTPTGLRYYFFQHKNGKQISKGDRVIVSYTVRLIDNSICYDYRGKNQQLIVLENIRHERGLVEGLKMMREGDKAIFIAPSYMSYGALGNNDKIPPRASLVYDIQSVFLSK